MVKPVSWQTLTMYLKQLMNKLISCMFGITVNLSESQRANNFAKATLCVYLVSQ
jgi:hypothetical protein